MIRSTFVLLSVCLFMVNVAVAQNKKEVAPIKDGNVKPASLETTTPWFDLEHCPMCKCFSSHEGLMDSIHWETHLIDDGMLAVTTIPAEMKEAMAMCKKDMAAVGKKLKSGESMDLCGFCTSYGSLVNSGAKVTEIETNGGLISMMTSDDPELVKKIQAHAKTTIKEYAAMVEPKK